MALAGVAGGHEVCISLKGFPKIVRDEFVTLLHFGAPMGTILTPSILGLAAALAAQARSELQALQRRQQARRIARVLS